MEKFRVEKDFLGELEVERDRKYGIHSLRAKSNFPNNHLFSISWYRAIGDVKRSFYRTVLKFKSAIDKKYPNLDLKISIPSNSCLNSMIQASEEISLGKYFDDFIVPAISGGAGTSINMNVNEIIANRSLEILGFNYGDYEKIDPVNDANIFQSTNDVIPSALKIAIMRKLSILESGINDLRFEGEKLENRYRDIMRMGHTQMQEAVPTSYGKLFSSYNNALSRDWWRVSKCFERIKVLNLGGGAIGTGLAIPRFVILEVINNLKSELNLPLSRSENMSDTTSNLDTFVEVHAILKSLSVNLEKMVSDLRLLSSDLVKSSLSIPEKQTGSSIMPGKVNPVIPEYVVSCSAKVFANDSMISELAAKGCLELNPYIPIIGDALLNSLDLMISSVSTIKSNIFMGLTIESRNEDILYKTGIATALVPYIGYKKSSELSFYMKRNNSSIIDANKHFNYIDNEKLLEIVKSNSLLKMGFSVADI
ncbi:MAG: aspartate ammonia-lyase [Candidatus Cloacimonadota bacterium]|nr:MAG: aspartate ammonia-lyase [Candidatus Cloacimonadota bacterium]PIE81647.1 MAG: aspartate ammonia-lyase [Candidatus Delongbacteria bacterium]